MNEVMNNSVFRETIENLRTGVNVKICRQEEEFKMRKLIARPSFVRAHICKDDLAAIQMHRGKITLNRPVCISTFILDLSKHLMHDFFYHQLRLQYRKLYE